MTDHDFTAHARELIDRNRYLSLATVDPDGRPWVSPVYFAPGEDGEFIWVSTVDAEHSRNLAARPDVSLVIFDSTVQPYHGRAVYASGEAYALAGDDLDRALRIYPGAADRGGAQLTLDDVTGDAPYRLYRAAATRLWVLCPREPRQPCAAHGLAKDHRAAVPLVRRRQSA
ncbi:pyridoxamine 5'-phosphate oxidase family protein [Fodinicola acaciae]|uniref:pyridoxamine 5'-phosphate oxidase family protein n=1 Tax=Fodinicola acaciae TaxID=2681555 RepID=UPI0013CFC4BC|nr:pyridoxamine 5'-phosphate oxidase family protein [Fodinicola acaciae]